MVVYDIWVNGWMIVSYQVIKYNSRLSCQENINVYFRIKSQFLQCIPELQEPFDLNMMTGGLENTDKSYLSPFVLDGCITDP